MRSLALSHQQYSDKIVECWGFDCLYHDDDPDKWKQWAQSNPAKKLFIYFGNGGTAGRSRILKTKAAALSNVIVDGNDALDHNQVPVRHGVTRLKALYEPEGSRDKL